jgi:hypothetical protein
MRRRGRNCFWPTPGLAHVRWAQKLSRVSRRPHRWGTTVAGAGGAPPTTLFAEPITERSAAGRDPRRRAPGGRLLARRPGNVCVMRVSRWRYLVPVALFGYRSGVRPALPITK